MSSVRPRGHDDGVRDRWQRWGPLSGIAYVILFLVGILAGGEGAGDSPEEHVAYYADAGNRAKDFAIFFVAPAASAAEESFRDVNPSAVNIVGNAGYAMFVCSIMVAGMLVLAASI